MVARRHFLKLGAFQAVVGGVIYLQAFHAQAGQIGDELLRGLIPSLYWKGWARATKAWLSNRASMTASGGRNSLGGQYMPPYCRYFLKIWSKSGPRPFARRALATWALVMTVSGFPRAQIFGGQVDAVGIKTAQHLLVALVSVMAEFALTQPEGKANLYPRKVPVYGFRGP